MRPVSIPVAHLGGDRPQDQARGFGAGLHTDPAAQLAGRHRRTQDGKESADAGTRRPEQTLRAWIASLTHHDPEAWVFPQDEDKRQPMWDSGVRSAQKAAAAEGCDFPGLGPHSLRRANITWRQEVAAASKHRRAPATLPRR